MTKAEIHTRIEKDIKPRKKKIEDEHKEMFPKFQVALFSLDEVIEKFDEPMIKFHRTVIQKGTEHYAAMLSRTDKLLEELEDFEADDGVLVDFEELKTTTKELSDLRTKFNKDFTAGKAGLDKANDALEEHTKGARDATEEWAVMEAWLRKNLELRKKRVGMIESVRETARKAVAARNDKALADAIKASAAIVDAKPDLEELQEDYSKFCTKCEAQGLSKELQDQLARDRKTFDGIMEEITALTGKIVAIDVEIEGLEVPPVDVKKAAALLKIPSTHEAKLKKALEVGPGMEKALDALVKELKLKMTGKEMIAALKKAKLL